MYVLFFDRDDLQYGEVEKNLLWGPVQLIDFTVDGLLVTPPNNEDETHDEPYLLAKRDQSHFWGWIAPDNFRYNSFRVVS